MAISHNNDVSPITLRTASLEPSLRKELAETGRSDNIKVELGSEIYSRQSSNLTYKYWNQNEVIQDEEAKQTTEEGLSQQTDRTALKQHDQQISLEEKQKQVQRGRS